MQVLDLARGLLYKIDTDTSRLLPLHNVLLLQVMQSSIKQRMVYILYLDILFIRAMRRKTERLC